MEVVVASVRDTGVRIAADTSPAHGPGLWIRNLMDPRVTQD